MPRLPDAGCFWHSKAVPARSRHLPIMVLDSFFCCWSFLAFRAPECRASVLGEPPHDSATSRGLAFFAFAVVDLKRVLEIAEFAGGLAMIAQRRAAGLDGLIEHAVNRRDQPPGMVGRLCLFGCQCRGQSSRRQMRAEQRLTDIDVAE